MRLFEIATPKLFLGTSTAMVIGSTIRPDEPARLLGDALEAVLESKRPSGRLPRKFSLFVSLSAFGGTDFTYIVEPQGRLEHQHTGWLKMLAAADPLQSGVRLSCAEGYWSGQECADERREPWEYRAEAALIVSRIGGSGRYV